MIHKQLFKEIQDNLIYETIMKYGIDYINNSFTRNVFPDDRALSDLKIFDEPLQDDFCPAIDVVNLLDSKGSPASVTQIGGRFFGFVDGGVVPAGLGARIFELWATLKSLGKNGIGEMIYTLHLRARQFAQELKNADFEVLNEIHFNQVLVFYKNSKLTMEILKKIQNSALCYGWIDGIRKTIDPQRYKIRFTPRKTSSVWSAVNVKKVKALISLGKMKPEGMLVYNNRSDAEGYSSEHRNVPLAGEYEEQIRANQTAWLFFTHLAPSSKRDSIWWVMSAKKEETRLRRLGILISSSEEGRKIPFLGGKKQ